MIDHNLKKTKMYIHLMFLGKFIPEPLILIKNKKINCFSNVCTHRGNIFIDKPCQLKKYNMFLSRKTI